MNKFKIIDDIMEVFDKSPSKNRGDIYLSHVDYDLVYLHTLRVLESHIDASNKPVEQTAKAEPIVNTSKRVSGILHNTLPVK